MKTQKTKIGKQLKSNSIKISKKVITVKNFQDDRPEVKKLLLNMKRSLPALEQLLREASSHWGFEDPIYRFYHGSFKVYDVQSTTLTIVAKLQSLMPERSLNDAFQAILIQGTGKQFCLEDNQRWLERTRPILEAFFHARFFLEMAIKYAKELKFSPNILESGWATLLYLYNLR